MLWSFMDTVGEPGVSPRGPPRNRAARLRLPSSGSLGHRFPTFPTRSAPLPACGTMLRSDCQWPISGSFGAPSPPPIPCIARLSLCPFSYKARVRGWRLLSTPGVFTVPVGTPTPDCTQGDLWLSQVPEAPPDMHAPRSDPGGVLRPRHTALRTAAFRPLHPVGFPSLRPEDDPIDHDYTYFGALSRSLHARSIQLRTPMT